MATEVRTVLNLLQNQLLSVVVENSGTAPSTPVSGQIYFNTGDSKFYYYNGSSWVGLDNSGVTTLAALTDTDVTTPASGNMLVYDGTNSWDNVAMSGHATLAANGTLTLSTTGVTASTYGGLTTVPQITVDVYGRITIASNYAFQHWRDLGADTGSDHTPASNDKVVFAGGAAMATANSIGTHHTTTFNLDISKQATQVPDTSADLLVYEDVTDGGIHSVILNQVGPTFDLSTYTSLVVPDSSADRILVYDNDVTTYKYTTPGGIVASYIDTANDVYRNGSDGKLHVSAKVQTVGPSDMTLTSASDNYSFLRASIDPTSTFGSINLPAFSTINYGMTIWMHDDDVLTKPWRVTKNASDAFIDVNSGVTITGDYFELDGSNNVYMLVADTVNDRWLICLVHSDSAGGSVTGAGTNDRVAVWSGSSSLDSDANFTFNGTTLTVPRISVADGDPVVAYFTNTAASGPLAGAGVLVRSDDGAAMASGDRLGFVLMGGAEDGIGTIYNSAGLVAYTTEAWSATASGSKLSIEVTPNTTQSRIEAGYWDQDGVFYANKNIAMMGSTSGSIAIAAPAVAGSNTITWPAATGTVALIDDTAYGAGWNGDVIRTPTKNAVYDKIEAMTLDGLFDTNFTSLTDWDVVRWDNATSKFINSDPSTLGGQINFNDLADIDTGTTNNTSTFGGKKILKFNSTSGNWEVSDLAMTVNFTEYYQIQSSDSIKFYPDGGTPEGVKAHTHVRGRYRQAGESFTFDSHNNSVYFLYEPASTNQTITLPEQFGASYTFVLASGADGWTYNYNITGTSANFYYANSAYASQGTSMTMDKPGEYRVVYTNLDQTGFYVWYTPFSGGGSGDVTKVGTPANDQIGVWTGDGTIEGDASLTWNGAKLNITGDLEASGAITFTGVTTGTRAKAAAFDSSGKLIEEEEEVGTGGVVIDAATSIDANVEGDGAFYIPIPQNISGDVVSVGAGFITKGASNTGATTIQLARVRAGVAVDMLSTRITIDANDQDSSSAATAAVINTANDDLQGFDYIRGDIDTTPTGGTAPLGLFIIFKIKNT